MADVAARTRISRRFLESIEDGDLSGLPGKFFYRSFVQQYAQALGLNPLDFKTDIDAVLPPDDPPLAPAAARKAQEWVVKPKPILDREPLSARTGVRFGLLVAMLVLCSAIYAWWDRRQHPPLETPNAVAAPQPRAVAKPTPPVALPSAPVTSAPTNQPPPAAGEAPGEASALAATAPPPAPAGKLQISVAAKEATWVSINTDGKVVFSGVLEPNQTKSVEGTERAKLTVGNAGGLEVTWNGKPLGSLGPSGQVRVVNFTPEKFDVQEPAKKIAPADPGKTPL